MATETDNKSVGTESVSSQEEVATMDNVSLEDDIEQQKPNHQPGGKTNHRGWSSSTKFVLGTLLLLCLIAVGVTVALTAGENGVVRTESSSAAVTTNDENTQSSPLSSPPEDSVASGQDTPQGDEATTTDHPFGPVALRGFSSDVIEGYQSVKDFEEDLTEALTYIAHSVIQWNLHHYHSEQGYGGENDDHILAATTGVALEAGEAASTASALNKQAQSAEAATHNNNRKRSSKTNNQEKDADESDIIKSDENFVYAAHSDHVLVWDRQGNNIHRINTTTANYVVGILLTDEHILLVSEGYDSWDDEDVGLYDRNVTTVEIYTKPNDSNNLDIMMDFVGKKSFNGYFNDARWMQDSNTIQVLTGGSTKTWEFTERLSPIHFPWMSKADYAKNAAKKASKVLIPGYVRAISRDLMMDGQLPNMIRLNSWTANDQTDASWKRFGQETLDQVMNSYSQITSFSVSDFGTNEELPASASLFFAPTNFPTLYGSDDKLVVALSKLEWDEDAQHSHETTFLLNLNVANDGNGVATEFQSVTMLEGSLTSRYALDVQGNDLRVATTIQKWFPLDNVFAHCDDSYYMFEDSCMTEAAYDQCTEVALNCPKDKVMKTGCPYTITCESNKTNTDDISSTENYIHVFDIEKRGEIREIGRVRIGEPHEIITSVHFGENFSYATTFDQRDPFYVLKLEAGQPPAISGSVTLEGFPSYMHPLDEDKSMLVGIGQNTSGTGLDQINSGILISVFDVSDPSSPQVVDSQMLDRHSYSAAEWDFKSIAYENGKLIIPATIHPEDYQWDDDMSSAVGGHFEGFIVLDVQNTEGIQELFRVHHSRPSGECRYCSAYYFSNPRSFLYDDGSIMTIRDNFVIATNMTSGKEIWRLEPHDEGETTKSCCW